jgi:hypothetical protein
MSEYGLEIRNASNVIIIDSTYKNHVYHQHGSTSVSQYLNEIDIDDLDNPGILFIKAVTGTFLHPYGFVKNGSVYDKIIIASSGSATAEWIVYKQCDTVSGNYGLNVYDSSSNIVFSSNEDGYVKVQKRLYYGGDTINGHDITVTDADNYYYALTGGGGKYEYIGSVPRHTNRYMFGFRKKDSNTVHLNIFIYYVDNTDLGSGGAGGVYSSVPNKFIVIKPPYWI